MLVTSLLETSLVIDLEKVIFMGYLLIEMDDFISWSISLLLEILIIFSHAKQYGNENPENNNLRYSLISVIEPTLDLEFLTLFFWVILIVGGKLFIFFN